MEVAKVNKTKIFWGILELRKKILFTVAMLLLFRLGCTIPVPFINTDMLTSLFSTDNVYGALEYTSGFAKVFSGAVIVTSFVAGSQFVLWLGKETSRYG